MCATGGLDSALYESDGVGQVGFNVGFCRLSSEPAEQDVFHMLVIVAYVLGYQTLYGVLLYKEFVFSTEDYLQNLAFGKCSLLCKSNGGDYTMKYFVYLRFVPLAVHSYVYSLTIFDIRDFPRQSSGLGL